MPAATAACDTEAGKLRADRRGDRRCPVSDACTGDPVTRLVVSSVGVGPVRGAAW